jgi:NADH-quinone oxidoreductase subunit L
MGFIYMLLGLESLYSAFLYLVVHAFIKIYLFLVVGAIIFYCNGCQDIRWMGGLYKFIPVLFVLYTVGAVAMGGLPYFSGYYCKANAVHVLGVGYSSFINLYFISYSVSFLTYVYLFRV